MLQDQQGAAAARTARHSRRGTEQMGIGRQQLFGAATLSEHGVYRTGGVNTVQKRLQKAFSVA
jgi:hypothetical protein